MYKRLADKSETKLKYYYHKDGFGGVLLRMFEYKYSNF